MGKTLEEIRSEERVEREEELRAEGRREERAAVVRSMRDAIQRYGSTMAMDGPGAVMQIVEAIERGDHWRGGEG